ncbi:MAG: FkbM family methyltransferase [Pseudomonadota bacterium]
MRGRDGPVDVVAACGMRLRLFPMTNRCEKRAVSGMHHWDHRERGVLLRALDRADRGRPFVFLDIGANVGLYAITVGCHAAAFGHPVRIVAVEPDDTNATRLRVNAELNGIAVELLRTAIGERSGTGRMVGGTTNRGEVRFETVAEPCAMDHHTAMTRMISLTDLCAARGIRQIDAMKIDIEGYDLAALRGMFAAAARSLWPRLLIVELGRGPSEIGALLRDVGYTVRQRTGINGIFELTA